MVFAKFLNLSSYSKNLANNFQAANSIKSFKKGSENFPYELLKNSIERSLNTKNQNFAWFFCVKTPFHALNRNKMVSNITISLHLVKLTPEATSTYL